VFRMRSVKRSEFQRLDFSKQKFVHSTVSLFSCMPLNCRPGKPTWDTKYLALHSNKLYIYNDSDELTSGIKATEEFDLCPNNGVVSVQSAVSQSELANVCANDLPFILKVEFETDASDVPSRFGWKCIVTQYCMIVCVTWQFSCTIDFFQLESRHYHHFAFTKSFILYMCLYSSNFCALIF
jgi:hypothetical protein